VPEPEKNTDLSESIQEQKEKEKAAQTRRSFLKGMGTAGVGMAASLTPLSVAAPVMAHDTPHGAPVVDQASEAVLAEAPAMGSEILVPLTLQINGEKQDLRIDPRASLLDTLRETVHLTGTKKGCDHGQCGACTVHIDGKRALSCLSLALGCQGREITTIEGLGTPEKMHPMQAAFVQCDSYQCGYCTSGQIMSAVALMKEPIGREDADVKEAMSGNICRCGAYANIVDAIQQVRKGKN
jgi:xanthine dehydrogenase YagT iron-sulfur-binding subunit